MAVATTASRNTASNSPTERFEVISIAPHP